MKKEIDKHKQVSVGIAEAAGSNPAPSTYTEPRYFGNDETVFNVLWQLKKDSYAEDEFDTATATTLQEACKLINVGYEYVTEMEGIKIFRKTQITTLFHNR
jgi:hypothetical protein